MPKTNPPEDETKAEKFRRVANPRAKTVIKYLGLLEGMIKQPAYETSPEDLDKLVSSLDKAMTSLLSTIEKAKSGTGNSKEIEDIF